MANAYIEAKAKDTAKTLSKAHNIDLQTALFITRSVWEEARRSILRVAGTEQWQRFTFKEKAYICRSVVKHLLDKKRLAGFLAGDRKSII